MQPAVYSYTRFSDPRQGTGQSVERQTQLAAQWAASRGLVLDASLSMHDEGLSAYHQRHVKTGALGVFLAAVEAGRIASGSILLVEQFDRLSRRTALEAQTQLVISAVAHEGLTVLVNGKPAKLAIVTADGRIVAAGDDVAEEAQAVAVNCYRSFLKGTGHLRVHSKPIEREPSSKRKRDP
jgi:hypothetical protein